MKVYTEVNYIWKDDKLVQTDSKSYEYEGEVTKCDARYTEKCVNIPLVGKKCRDVYQIHVHTDNIIPDNAGDLLDNALNLGGDVLNLGGDVISGGADLLGDGMGLNILMEGGQNIFNQTANVLGKGGLFTNDLISGVINGDWTGANVGKHGLFGLGTPNLGIPSYGGATSPNFGDLGSGKFGENMNWLGGKLSGKGYLHDRAEALANYSRESFGHMWAFIQNPKEYIVNDQLASMLLAQSGIPLGGAGDGGGGGDDGTSLYVKGRGTMRGRAPSLKLNKGGKGFGRKSLRIGTGGMGEPVGGKFKTYKSGRYTRVH